MSNDNVITPLVEMPSKGKTKGKMIGWRVKEGGALMEFAFVGGGQLPKALQGSFTSIRVMHQIADEYARTGDVTIETYVPPSTKRGFMEQANAES